MKILIAILSLTCYLQSQVIIPSAYHKEAQIWWAAASRAQKDNALWYTRWYGADEGSKSILETSGGKYTDHGDEKSYRDLGLNRSLHPYRSVIDSMSSLFHWKNNDKPFRDMPVMTIEAFMDSLKYGSMAWHGQLCRDKLDHDMFLMRNKVNKQHNIAFVYPGWKLWAKRKVIIKMMINRGESSLDDVVLLHKWRRRTHRALLDLAFQELLEKELKN